MIIPLTYYIMYVGHTVQSVALFHHILFHQDNHTQVYKMGEGCNLVLVLDK